MPSLTELLDASSALHHHLCPRQVLGVRMGLQAGQLLGLDVPQSDKRLLTIVETDGCAADGIAVATNCWVGRRTMRVKDFGKVAATFVDTRSGQAVRIFPRIEARKRAWVYAPEARGRWEAQLLGYRRMSASELLSVQTVQLKTPLEKIISQPDKRAVCEICSEEIMNEREIVRDGIALCQSCAGPSYYHIVVDFTPAPITVVNAVEAG